MEGIAETPTHKKIKENVAGYVRAFVFALDSKLHVSSQAALFEVLGSAGYDGTSAVVVPLDKSKLSLPPAGSHMLQ
eukprot:1619711-Amphidinium_carterae.1